MTTNFELSIDDDVHFKAYLHTNVKPPTEYELRLKNFFTKLGSLSETSTNQNIAS